MKSRWCRVVGIVALMCALVAPAATAQRVKIVLSNWHLVEPHWEKSIKEAVAEFMVRYPNIEVVLDYVSYAEKETKYMTAIEAGVGPDVMHLGPAEISFGLFATRGYFRDLTPFIQAEAAGFLDAWYPGVVDALSHEGKVYGLGNNYQAMVLMWNKRLFAEAGLDPERPPQTWEELLDYAKKLTRDRDGDGRIDTWGLGMVGRVDPGFQLRFTPILFGFGATYLSADYRCAAINTAAAKEAVKFFVDLFVTHGVVPPGVTDMTPGKVREQFAAEKIAMKITSAWGPPIVKSIRPDVDWDNIIGIAPVPVKAGTNPEIRTTAFLSYYAMNRNTKNPKESWELLKFLTSKEAQEKWFRDARVLSARRDVSQQYQLILDDPYAKVIGAELSRAAMVPMIPEWPQIIEAINVAVQKGLLGQPVDPAWRDAYLQINDILAGRRRAGERCPAY